MSAFQTIKQGFQIYKDLLSPDECDSLVRDISGSIVDRGRAGARHLMAIPQISQLANDRRLIEIARLETGNRAIPFRATLFEKSGKANWLVVWHQDTALPLKNRFEAEGWGP